MKRLLLTDRATYKISNRVVTDEGFLKAPARVSRIGVQQYLAGELELQDRDPNEVIGVFRSEDEVFSQASLESFNLKEITNDHPTEMVSSDNYRDLSVGQVTTPGTKDENFVKVDLIVKDANSIRDIEEGKTELSAGYYADYIQESGTFDGVEYEFVQRNIVINHVALVDKARAGADAVIFDSKNKGGCMATRKVTLDKSKGRTVDLDDAVASQVEDAIDSLQSTIDTHLGTIDKHKESLSANKATIDGLKEDNDKLKESSSDEAISKRVESTLDLHSKAKLLVSDIVLKDKSNDAIKLEVVTSLHPKRDFKDADSAYINATFDTDVEKKEESDQEEEEEEETTDEHQKSAAQDLAGTTGKDKLTVTDGARLRQSQASGAHRS